MVQADGRISDVAQSSTERSKPDVIRVSVTLPADVHRTLEQLAREKRVSLAWVIRDAAEQYIANREPLFGRAGEK